MFYESDKKRALEKLLNSLGGIHISIYLERQSDPLAMRRCLSLFIKAIQKKLAPVVSEKELSYLLEPFHQILGSEHYLERAKANLGIFRSNQYLKTIQIPTKLRSSYTVANSFHVKPLLSWLQNDPEFFLLGMEEKALQLYQGSQHFLRHIDTFILDQSPQFGRSGLSFPWPLGLKRKLQLNRAISLWLSKCLQTFGNTNTPTMFFAGPSRLTEDLKQSNPRINFSSHLTWNSFKTTQLDTICSEIRRFNALQAKKEFESSFQEFQYAKALNLADNNIYEISRAAIQGRVKRMLIDGNVDLYGKLNPKTGELKIHFHQTDHEDDCVLDDLAQTVLKFGGQVYVSKDRKVPSEHSVLAIVDPQDPEMRLEQPHRLTQERKDYYDQDYI